MNGTSNSNSKSKLIVEVQSAIDLAAKDIDDPYVDLHIGNQRFRTKAISRCLHPHWNESFTFEINEEEPKLELIVDVWDKDSFKQDDFLGRATFPISALKMCNLQEGSYFLRPRSSYDKEIKGEIQLRIELIKAHEERVSKEYMVGYMNKQGAPGLITSWKKRWFVLDREKLAYFPPELEKKSQPIFTIPLKEIVSIYLDKNHEFSFALKTTTKGNRTFIISVESKKSLARWVLSIDGLKNISSKKFQSVLDTAVKKELLIELHLKGIIGGTIKLKNIHKHNVLEEWSYSPEGFVKCKQGPPQLIDAKYTWDAYKFGCASEHHRLGYGQFDGVRLAWMNQDTVVEPYNYFYEDRTYHNLNSSNLTCEFNGSTMKCVKFPDVLWTIDGDIPGTNGLCTEIMHLFASLTLLICIISCIVAERSTTKINTSQDNVNERRLQERQPNAQSFQLFWSGGNSSCNNCSVFGGLYYSGSFACDYNNIGNWNNGSITFPDLIPTGSVVTQVFLTVVGLFNCRYQPQGLSAFFQLNYGLLIDEEVQLPIDPKGCLCPNCITPTNIASQYNAGGIGFYNYGNTNTLSIIPVDNSTGMCLSYINVTLFYTPAAPQIGIYAPHGGPTSGSTLITFFGEGFSSDVRYYCLFNGVPTNATVGGEGILLSCMSPPMILGIVNLSIEIAISGDQVAVGTFEYYAEPRVYNVVPDETVCDGRNVTVVGSGFFDLDKAFKCFWSVSQPNLFGGVINSTAVWCGTPVGITGTQDIQVSMNGQQSTKKLAFTCSPPPTPTPPQPKGKVPGWAWVVVIFGGATLLVVSILTLSRRCTKKPEDFEDSLSRSSLLNPDGTPNIFVKKIEMSDIKLFQKIGKGTFGEVFKGVWNGTDVAVKFLTSPNMNEQFLQDFYKEVLIMRSLRHPNVLQFLGACTNPPDIFIVMEYMPLGSLYKILHDESVSLYLDLLKRMLMDAAKGMNYLHRSDPIIIHRDLKSHNLLVDENWKVKVCDFGLSKILETQSDFNQMTACGTPSWTAPEILRNEKYTEKADVYSFGIVLWECMSRDDPYYGMPPFQVVLAVGTKGMRPTIPTTTPTNWALLIQDSWAEQPSQRPSFDDIISRIEYLEGGKQQIVRP